LKPHECLKATQSVEQAIGRKEKSQNLVYSSRLIDIDILFYNDEIIDTKDLTIPHPRLHLRNFTLQPLNELMPEYIHPKLKKSIEWLCQNSEDKDLCKRIS
jgi:2-amino-4-hydroxy-6-hydroxymethyldihydropteridine diphosphokinase